MGIRTLGPVAFVAIFPIVVGMSAGANTCPPENAATAVATQVAKLSEQSEVLHLALSADGRLLATNQKDAPGVQIWDWAHHRLMITVGIPDATAQYGIYEDTGEALAFGPDGRTLVTCNMAFDRDANRHITATVWDVPAGRYNRGLSADANCSGVGYAPDGAHVFELLEFRSSHLRGILYDAASWQPLWTWEPSRDVHGQVFAMSPDNKSIAIGTSDVEFPNGHSEAGQGHSRIHVLDMTTGSELRVFEPIPGVNHLYGLAWLHDGATIAVIEGNAFSYPAPAIHGPVFALLAADTGQIGHTVGGAPPSAQVLLRATPDGRYLVVNGLSSVIEIWDSHHQKLLQEICGQAEAIAISADSRYMALGGARSASMFAGAGKVLIYKFK